MRSEEIQRSLERLKASSQEIEAVALVSQEGFIIASLLPETIDEERISVLSITFQSLAERYSTELGKGQPRRFFIQTDYGYIVVMDIGLDTYLTVMSNRFGRPGLLLLDMKRTAEELLALL